MQLLLSRGQRKDNFGRPVFDLVAQFELTSQERELIGKYDSRDFVLAEGDMQRDFVRAGKYAAALGFVVFILLAGTQGFGFGVGVGVLVFAGGTLLIYQNIREEIRVADMLTGRSFTCRSVVTLVAKEQSITEMAGVFRRFLEAMKNWGGKEVIAIEPDQVPTLRVIEPPHAAA
jgi:hypothetical protein